METRRSWHRPLYVAVWLFWALMLLLSAGYVEGDVPRWERILDPIFGFIILVALRWRHRYPTAIALLAVLLSPWAGSAMLGTMWAFASLSTTRNWKRIAVPGVIVLVYIPFTLGVAMWADPALTLDTPDGTPYWVFPLVVGTASILPFLAAFGLGVYVGARRDLLRSQQQQAELALERAQLALQTAQADERNRIAREMHDVVAHRISLISMQASALTFRGDLSPEQTREIATQIQQNSRLALDELRSVLGSLRNVDDTGLVAKPQPTIAQLPALIADARDAGQRIEARIAVDDAPAQISRHAFRIVQEGLTNARKHAPSTLVTLLVDRHDGGLRIMMSNPLRVGASTLPGAHQGLIGVQERVEMAGGTFSAGVSDNEFQVKAWMPWPES